MYVPAYYIVGVLHKFQHAWSGQAHSRFCKWPETVNGSCLGITPTNIQTEKVHCHRMVNAKNQIVNKSKSFQYVKSNKKRRFKG